MWVNEKAWDKQQVLIRFLLKGPVWARECCRISPARFLAECCKRQLNQGSFVLLYFRLFTFSDLYWVCLSVFSCTVGLSVSVKWLAVKTASEMTYIVSSGALNSTPTNHSLKRGKHWAIMNWLTWKTAIKTEMVTVVACRVLIFFTPDFCLHILSSCRND